MPSIQKVATVSGVLFILVSVVGFVAGAVGHPMMMSMSTDMLLGFFPVNALHNLVHLLFGIWGVWAGRSAVRSIGYALGSGAAYLILAVAGMFTPVLLGVVPIGGYDVELHLLLAMVLAPAGFWAMWFAPIPQNQPEARPAA